MLFGNRSELSLQRQRGTRSPHGMVRLVAAGR
jgi:hypothetical protein